MFSSLPETKWWDTRIQLNTETISSLNNPVLDLYKSYFDFTDPTCNTPLQLDYDPGEINVYYDNDLDLKNVHNILKEKIVRILIRLKNCDQEIFNFNLKIQSNNHAPIDKRDMEFQLKELNSFKIKYYNNNIWEIYKNNVSNILMEYIPLMSKEFIGTQNNYNQNSNTDIDIKKRQDLIKQYLNEINKLGILKIKYYQIVNSIPTCPSCMAYLKEDVISDTNGSFICNCGFSESTVKHLSEYIDSTNFVSSSLTIDNYIKQIKQWIDNYLCRSLCDYNKIKIFEKFDSLCFKNNLPNRIDVIKCLIPQPYMRVIITLLQLTENTHLYINKHQIRHDYYNYPKPNITDVQEAAIIKLYIDFQNKYNEIKERKTSVHIEILGCVFLIMVGIDINPSDFKIPISIDTISYSHNSITEVLLELGYKREQIPNVRSIFS